MNRSLRFALCFLGMTLVPCLLLTVYLTLTRGHFRQFMRLDDLAIAITLVAGLTCVAWLPVRARARWVIGILYVPAAVFLSFCYAVTFVCACYGDCL